MRLSTFPSLLCIVMLITAFLTSSLLSSETRVATLGGGSIFIKDQSNVFLFPGTILQYPDVVVSEMRAKNANSVYTIGLHLGYENMVSGIYVNQPIFSTALSAGQGILNSATPINNAFAYFLGLPLAGMDMGFGLIAASTSYEDENDVDESASYIGILAGASTKKMDLGLLLEIPSVSSDNGTTTTDYSGFALEVNGRYNLLTRKGFSIFPVAQFSFGSTEIDGGTETGLFGFAAGIGAEKQINEDNLLVVGVEGFGMSSISTKTGANETTTTSTVLPAIYLGVESRITDWLIGRVGAAQVNVETDVESDTGTDNITVASQFKITLGLGMEFGNFLIDYSMNEGLLFDGPYVFGRSDNATQFAGRISITYNFSGGEDE